tara:strand:- start:2 stop:241 length:240 start_codon:yes stop_codon:yes gene_type:complete
MGKTKKQLEQIVLKKSKAPELFEGRTKEWNDIPERQYRSNQGRSPQKTEANYKVMFLALVGMLAMFIGTMLYTIIKDLF